MRLLLLPREHAGINNIADNPVAEGKSRGINCYGSEKISTGEGGDAFGRVNSLIANEFDCFNIRYRESRAHGARDFENELFVEQKSVCPSQNSGAGRLGKCYRAIIPERFNTGRNTSPSLRPALFDHPADLTNEKRISTGTLPDRLLQPNGDIGMLERRADQLSRVGFVERFKLEIIDIRDPLQNVPLNRLGSRC